MTFTIAPLRPPAASAYGAIEHLLDEYVRWCVDEFHVRGVRFADREVTVARHHSAFRAMLPELLGPRGRLFVAILEGDVVGTCALEPVGAGLAEVKRMYVRPAARGSGIARALLASVLDDASILGYTTLRLETARFMTAAQNLYGSLGFTDIEIFDNAEASLSGFESEVRFMQLTLESRRTGRRTGG